MKRIESLDYLRGYAAFTIMIYHYLSWSDYHGFFYFFLGKLGYYAVEVFYILSGFALTVVYEKRSFFKKTELKKFYLKRAFRIFPLLWFCIILTLVLRRELPDLERLLINLTGLFSVYQIDQYIAIGSWSIGNELFFYLCFPILISVQKKWHIISVICLLLIPFAIIALGEYSFIDIGFNWKVFINPLNHLVLFYFGILLRISRVQISTWWSYLIIFIFFVSFLFIPFSQRQDAVLGLARFYNSGLMILLVLVFASFKPSGTNKLNKFSKHLGKVSYSLYLLHPLVWGSIGFVYNQMEFNLLDSYASIRIILSVIISLIFSTMIYNWLEVRFIELGKRFIAKRS